ncbi:XRE family transcriptional regulator [Gallibacterium sp. AGMB14963]|nr:XRE family transcriptional regulator [Gallibacterium sp. AGMB14963]
MKLKGFIEVTGLPYRTGQSYLSGVREPNAEGMQIICTRMRININWLLTGSGAMFIDELECNPEGEEITLLENFRKSNEVAKKAIYQVAKTLSDELNQ